MNGVRQGGIIENAEPAVLYSGLCKINKLRGAKVLVLPILSSLAMIFVMILPGIFFKKRSMITVEQNGAVNSIIVNLTWPCLVIDAMQIPFSTETLRDTGYILVACIVIFGVLLLVGIPVIKVMRLTKNKQYLVMFMLLFGNTGFIGIPVIKALYGTEALFFAAIVEFINDILLFTVGVLLIQMSAGAALKIDIKELFSPGLAGVLIGIILFLLDFRLPGVMGGAVEMIGNATTPLTMFSIGFQLGGLKLREILNDWQVYAVLFVKLLLVPCIALAVMKLWAGEFTLLEKVLVLSFAMPVASVAAIFSQQYKGEAVFATKSVLLSTVMSLATIPVFAILLEL